MDSYTVERVLKEIAGVNTMLSMLDERRKTRSFAYGIGGPLFRVTAEAHQELLQYLKDNQDDYWVATFSEAMDFQTARKTK